MSHRRGCPLGAIPLLVLAAVVNCGDENELWIAPPEPSEDARTVFLVVEQGTEIDVVLRALPLEEPAKFPLRSPLEAPAIVRAIFTPYSLSELQQTEGSFNGPLEPTTTLGALEHEAFWLHIPRDTPSEWKRSELTEPVRSLGLRPQLCPELEYRALPHGVGLVVSVSQDRAALLTQAELVWFEWNGASLETSTVALAGESLAGLAGFHEDDNTFWLGGTELSRLMLEPRGLTRFASFAPGVVRDFILLRAGGEPQGLVLTDLGDLYLVDSSTTALLGSIPGDRGGVRSAGFAVSEGEGRYFAAAAGGASILVFSRSEPLREERLSTLDSEGLAFGATSRSLGPMLVTRPIGDVYVRDQETSWSSKVRLGDRVRAAADFGSGVLFFDPANHLIHCSERTGSCRDYVAPWSGAAVGAPVGPHLLVSRPDRGESDGAWLVSLRPPN